MEAITIVQRGRRREWSRRRTDPDSWGRSGCDSSPVRIGGRVLRSRNLQAVVRGSFSRLAKGVALGRFEKVRDAARTTRHQRSRSSHAGCSAAAPYL